MCIKTKFTQQLSTKGHMTLLAFAPPLKLAPFPFERSWSIHQFL